MLQIKSVAGMTQRVEEWKRSNLKIAFVPTMGNLHQGHLSLVEYARTIADKVIVSIYVNPLQFGVNEDLDNYPRTLESDQKSLEALEIDLLFLPDDQAMYSDDTSTLTYVSVPGLSKILCGEFRPGHFDGVTTVVNKLLNIVQADFAIFGEKDFQQVFIIKKMVDDLFMPVKIVSLPTVREADGLAMSSRNQYLDKEQRQQAAQIYQTLQLLKKKAKSGVNLRLLESNGVENLLISGFRVDYVSFRSKETLLPAKPSDQQLVLLIAAWMGETRLIDNLVFDLTAVN